MASIVYKTPGLHAIQWNNTANSDVNGKVASQYATLTPDCTHNQVSNVVATHCFALEQNYITSSSVFTDPANGQTYALYASSDESVRNHKFMGYFARLYLNAGDIFTIYGCADDYLYVQMDDEAIHTYFTKSPGTPYYARDFSSCQYTATADGYHYFRIIIGNVNTAAGCTTSGIPLQMTIAPAGSKLTSVTSTSDMPTTGNTIGDRCRVCTTVNGKTLFEEYLWTSSGWKKFKIGNVDLDEPRFFLDIGTKSEVGKILGTIPGNEKILTGEDVAWAYKSVTSIPSAATDPDRVVVLADNISGYSEGTVLIAKENKKGTYTWTQLASPTEGVEHPYSVRSHRIGDKVWIRWKDPEDVMTQYGEVTCKWKYTRLLRKWGSTPSGPYDGQVVVQNTVRNYYNDREFVDVLPSNMSTDWCYKLFAYSEDGVVSTSTESAFVPAELTWSKMHSYIYSGRASSIFGIGDVITVEGGEDSSIYKDMEFVVAGFDMETPAELKKYPHTITLISRFCPNITGNGYFDKPWGPYRLVKDEYVLETGKTIYYTYDESTKSYHSASPQPTAGKHITEQDGLYVRVTNSDRANYGSNQWSECALRQWLNETRLQIYKLTADTTVTTGKKYFKKESDSTYAYITSIPTGTNPNAKGWYEEGTAFSFIASDLPPYLGLKALDMHETTDTKFIYGKAYYTYDSETKNYVVATVTAGSDVPASPTYYEAGGFFNCIVKHVNTTALNKNLISGGVISTTTTDFASIPSITEVFGEKNNNVLEGKALEYFSVVENALIRRKNNSYKTITDWWLRSPDTTTESVARYVTTGGVQSTATVATSKGIAIKLVLG